MDSLTGRNPGHPLSCDGLFEDDDRRRLVDDTAEAPLLQASRMQIPVSGDGGEPLVYQPDAHPPWQAARQISRPRSGVLGRARVATTHVLGQADDHLEGTVLLDKVNGLIEVCTIAVPPESYHRKRQDRVLIATSDTNTCLSDIEGDADTGTELRRIRLSR